MKKGINLRIESIFSHAVALQQSGRLRNTIYCTKKFIYILNQDCTIIIRFKPYDIESFFKHPISFEANDYDSKHFEERNGKIYFTQRMGDYIREKSCKTPQYSPATISKVFKQHKERIHKVNKIVLDEKFKSCLDETLSHIEFSSGKKWIIAKQRNIYTGSVIKIQPAKKEEFGIRTEKLKPFEPIGIRTNDFLALFQFANSVTFYFSGEGTVWFESNDKSMPFVGVMSQCMYDELGIS